MVLFLVFFAAVVGLAISLHFFPRVGVYGLAFYIVRILVTAMIGLGLVFMYWIVVGKPNLFLLVVFVLPVYYLVRYLVGFWKIDELVLHSVRCFVVSGMFSSMHRYYLVGVDNRGKLVELRVDREVFRYVGGFPSRYSYRVRYMPFIGVLMGLEGK